ncbi:MAG: hypothetical protein AAB373_01155 [Patescibacteria group bacterium]
MTQQAEGATIYLTVDKDHPAAAKFSGDHNGEIVNDDRGYVAHLAPKFGVPESGVNQRHSREGNGDIVIQEISRDG